jgi:AraC-like DNA-binding protein/mannose-6-phosphate isomerase-like protein (cupin superfamily)
MSINLSEAMEEYARLPFEPFGAHYKNYCAGHKETEYNTKLSSFIFALDGKATIYLDNKPFAFGTNRVIHCAPNQRFRAENEEEQPAKLFEVAYFHDSSHSDYMYASYELEICNNAHIYCMLQRLTQLSQKAYSKIDANTMLQAKTMTYSILSEMFSSAQSMKQEGNFSVVEDARIYIEQNYMKLHTLQELGSRYGMSAKYFASMFKQYRGISPIEYLITCRMNAARMLLQSTVYSVKEISCSVGYEDALYFSRHFKSRFGLSPSEWREQILKD